MAQEMNLEHPPPITVIERSSEMYVWIVLSTTSTEFTQESDVGGEPNDKRTFGITLTDYPAGHIVRAAFLDFSIYGIQDLSGSLNYLNDGGDANRNFPWFIKKSTNPTWVQCGYIRLGALLIAANASQLATLNYTGFNDIKAEIDGNATYNIRIGGPAASERWRSQGNDLHFNNFNFRLRLEII